MKCLAQGHIIFCTAGNRTGNLLIGSPIPSPLSHLTHVDGSCNMYSIRGGRLREGDFWVKQIFFDLNQLTKEKANPSPLISEAKCGHRHSHIPDSVMRAGRDSSDGSFPSHCVSPVHCVYSPTASHTKWSSTARKKNV